MRWTWLVGLMALPVGAQAVTKTIPLTPSQFFLLKADGQNFKDAQGKIPGSVKSAAYTSQFTLEVVQRGNRSALGITLHPVDKQHHLSLDRQVAGLEVDGTALPFIDAFDTFSYRSPDGTTENVNLVLSPTALKQIGAAQKEVAVKIRLESIPLGRSGECAQAVEGSAKQLACANAYTGAMLRGTALKQLQQALAPAS